MWKKYLRKKKKKKGKRERRKRRKEKELEIVKKNGKKIYEKMSKVSEYLYLNGSLDILNEKHWRKFKKKFVLSDEY